MQDFNYVYGSCFEVTFELSCCKYPMASELPEEWIKNKESLLAFMEKIHMGAKGECRHFLAFDSVWYVWPYFFIFHTKDRDNILHLDMHTVLLNMYLFIRKFTCHCMAILTLV